MKVAVRIYNTSGGGQHGVPEEGDVVAWMKSAGDRVIKGEVICEIEMEKGVVEIFASANGMLVDITYPIGKKWIRGEVADTIAGTPYYDPPFCWIKTDEITAVAPQESVSASVADEPAVTSKKPKPFISLTIGRLMQEHSISVDDLLLRFPDKTSFSQNEINSVLLERYDASLPLEQKQLYISEQIQMLDSRVRARDEIVVNVKDVSAVPAARKRAAELGINLFAIHGSGPDSLILLADIEAHQSQVPLALLSAPLIALQSDNEEVVPLKMSRLLRTIAVNMEHARRIPTVDTMAAPDTFDFAPLISFYQRFRKQFSYALWFPVMASAARVLGREEFIVFNSFFPEQDVFSGFPLYVHTRKRVHMGISYDRGEVPVIDWENKTIGGEALRILVIRDAHTKTVAELIREVQRLLKAAARRRFEMSDVTGYTFIFNNIGVIGHHSGRSLLGEDIGCQLNLGYVDMYAGKGVLQAVFDHRLINGARSTPFVRAIHKEMTECVIPELEVYLGK